MTTWGRVVEELRREYERRWGFPPEMADKVAEWEAAGKPEPFEFDPEEGGRHNASFAGAGACPISPRTRKRRPGTAI